jgi:hypothetical protein
MVMMMFSVHVNAIFKDFQFWSHKTSTQSRRSMAVRLRGGVEITRIQHAIVLPIVHVCVHVNQRSRAEQSRAEQRPSDRPRCALSLL